MSSASAVTSLPETPRPGLLARAARRAILARLAHVERGELSLVDASGVYRFGAATPELPLRARLEVRDPAFWLRVALGGPTGAAEAYMDAHWTCDDLPALVRLILSNPAAFGELEGGASRLARPARRALHALRSNTRAGSRRNISAHYDLGNDFFELFLDPTLTYSSALFEKPEATLEEAQAAKYERICRKLQLSAADHVLEIGTGWGGFALHAAGRHGCRVTTTTISRQQYERARERVAAAGLSDRITLLLQDYRDLSGRFDKIVSIEMIEAVGDRYLDEYFRVCSDRLAPDGAMLLQAITCPDQRYARSVKSVDFIKQYIFPGGQLPSLGAMTRALARGTDLRVAHLEDITPHYAETLRRWRERLAEARERILALGYSGEFLRMWEFYFSSCEGAFAERYVGTAQILLDKPRRRAAPLLGSLGGLGLPA